MKLLEAITLIDTQKPNTYSVAEKTRWISELDGRIKNEIIDTHEGGGFVSFNGYDEDTPPDTELLVKSPFDNIYVAWLETRIDYHNSEIARYNNSTAVFNTIFSDFSRAYNRAHMPIGKKIKYF